jgi:hypothetical protein
MIRAVCLIALSSSLSGLFVSRTAMAAGETSPGPAAVKSARELFDLFGIDEALFQRFVPNESLSEAERELLARIMLRLPQIKLLDVQRWAKRVNPSELKTEPDKYQREIIRLEGRVRRVTRETPAQELQDRFAIQDYYRCEVAIQDRHTTAIIFAHHVPSAWPINAAIDERASADAVFLKKGPVSMAGDGELYFAANRIAWHPDTLLGQLGMDCGLFDTVEQMRPITHVDRECFFQLLAAAGRATAEQLTSKQVDPSTQLAPLLRSPDEHLGERYTFRGVARRAVKIHITDEETVSRFGFDHYFELVIFLNIDGVIAGERVRSHPVVFCVRELPQRFPLGEDIAEVVRATGFMFKKWPYTTQATDAKDPDLRIASPLLAGKTVAWEPSGAAKPSSVGPIMGVVLIAAIAAVSGIVWWIARRERSLRDAETSKRRALPAGQSLDDLSFDTDRIAIDD